MVEAEKTLAFLGDGSLTEQQAANFVSYIIDGSKTLKEIQSEEFAGGEDDS